MKEKNNIVFKDKSREIEIDKNGLMWKRNTYTHQEVLFLESIPLLEKALKKSKEIITIKKDMDKKKFEEIIEGFDSEI